ncbi:MAG: hypothetical protein GX596_05500 [Propionibacterium sp.]|nr:hypothetical protein [Propionibacterium sp.]
MEFRDNAKIDQSRVRYGGGGAGGRRGKGLAIGGGAGGLILVVLLMLVGPQLGINPADLLGGDDTGGQAGQPAGEVADAPECRTGADIERDPECRWPAYVTSVDDFWDGQVEGYRSATTQLFRGSIQTACGTGSSHMGPFYCPGDEQIYIDTDFMGDLLGMLGARGGYAAEAYIVAHEYGHHVQHLTGQMQRARQGGDTGAGSGPVRLELQADCYAGVWFHHTIRDETSLIESVSQDDLARIVDAARAVGDDHIQQQQTGRVVEENWTHGSSAQRQKWVRTGFDTGDPIACDTFATDDLG